MIARGMKHRRWLGIALGLALPLHGASYTEFSSYYWTKDLLPTAVSHGGASSLATNDVDMLTVNPAMGIFLRMPKAVQFTLNMGILPDGVGFQQLGALLRLDRTNYVYLFANQVTADVDYLSGSLEDMGEINARAFTLGINTGGGFGIYDQRFSYGGTLKLFSSKYFTYTRQALALDLGIQGSFRALRSQAFITVKNLGFDLLAVAQVLDPTNTQAGLSATNRALGYLPTSLAFGWGYRLLDLFLFEVDMEYVFPSQDMLVNGADGRPALGLLDGEWKPKLGLDFIAFRNIRLSMGWYWRPNTGIGTVNFGGEWDTRILDMGVTLKYALSPLPNLPPSHTFGISLRLD